MNFEVTVAEIANEFQAKGVLSGFTGDAATIIRGISAIETCKMGDLVFMDKKEYLPVIQERRPSAVVVSAGLKESLKDAFSNLQNVAVFTSGNVSLAHALLKRRYADRDLANSGWSGIHASAVVHETAQIGAGTVIEPNAVIGMNVRIGKNSRVMAGVVIENGAVIGDETVIHPKVVIGYGCQIGSQVVIGSGTVIGSEGFGFAQDAKRKSYPIPQTGIVVIGDRVRIGAGNCIDRATYSETRIGAGTKTDNLCHIAHNVVIGEDCLLTAMLCVAGSSKIGNRVITSGNTGILDHVDICDDVVLLHRAGVTKDIEKPGAYAGVPLLPLGEYLKNSAVLKNATDLRKRLMTIEKTLGLDEKGKDTSQT